MPTDRKDVFVIHSKREPLEAALAARLIEWLGRLAIPVYEYGDWTWDEHVPGKPRYSASGSHLDPVRYAMGHPEPFRRQTRQERPDRDTLDDMLGDCRVVVFVAPRSGSPSPGVDVERDVLRQEAALVVASWGDQNDWVVRDLRPGHVYPIADRFGTDQETAALDLAHLVWLHWVLDHMARDCKEGGRRILVELARREPALRRILRFAGRISKSLGQTWVVDDADARPAEVALGDLVEETSPDQARLVLHHWLGPASLRAVMPPPPNAQVAGLVAAATRLCDDFCAAMVNRHRALADEQAEARRHGAALASGVGHAELAARHYAEALALPGLSNAVRAHLLADRAALQVRAAPAAALNDIDEVLALPGASVLARSSALWLRARLALRRGDATAALADLSAALDLPEIAPTLRALCLHDRATVRARAGQRAEARDDLDHALAIRGLTPAVAGPAHLDRAVLCGELGDTEAEPYDYARVIALGDVPDETRLKAHMYRGMTRRQQGNRLGAIEDFVVVRDDPAAPEEARRAAVRQLAGLDPLRERDAGDDA